MLIFASSEEWQSENNALSHACDEAASHVQLLPVGRQPNLCLISVHPLPVV